MKIRKVALLGLGLLALSVAPAMAFDHEGEFEYEMEFEGDEEGSVSAAAEASVAYEGEFYETPDYPQEIEERHEYRHEYAYNYSENGTEERYEYRYEHAYEGEYKGEMEYKAKYGMEMGAEKGEVHVLVTANGKPVKAISYVVVDGIVKEVDVGASFSVYGGDGQLYIAAEGYPLFEVDAAQLSGSVKVDLSTGEVVPFQPAQGEVEGSGEMMKEKMEQEQKMKAEGSAGGASAEGEAKGEVKGQGSAKVEGRAQAEAPSMEELKYKLEEMFRAKGEDVKVAEVKVKAENGKMVYVAVVKKPFRLGPIVLPFEVSEEVEISAEELEE